jgi:peptidoglycan/xylan/chitin deacetylase (PgdA/CDA1 family)
MLLAFAVVPALLFAWPAFVEPLLGSAMVEPVPTAAVSLPTSTSAPIRTAAPTATPLIASPTATLTQTPTNAPTFTATPLPTENSSQTAVLPTPDSATQNRRVRLPILMYHYVEPWPANADKFRQALTVTPEDFAAQMQYLADHGYVTVSLYDLTEALTLGRPLPEKAVVLTFDDGYRGLLDYALPVMEPLGFTGTVFVITEFADRELPGYLTWPHLKDLAARGWRIEPHGKTHLTLAGRDRDTQVYQMLGAIETIEANLGARPRFFCYPVGKYDDLTLRLAEEMHLWGAVTTGGGRTHSFTGRYTWDRMRIDGRGLLADFVSALEGDLR